MKTNFSTGLIVAFSKELINFAFNGLTGNYEKKAEVIINDILRDDCNTGHQFVCMFSNYIFYNTGKQILRFNTNLEEVISKKIRLLNLVDLEKYLQNMLSNLARLKEVEETTYEEERQHYLKEFHNDERTAITIGAIATDGKNLFVAGEGSLIVYNSDLEELSRVNLEIGPPVKNAHDILIHEDTVYLLDNIFHPIYIFKINISDINNIKITEKNYQGFPYRHLNDQWLNPSLDQWLMTAGDSRDVLIYSMSEEKRLFSILETYDCSNISYLRFEQKRKERLKKQEEFVFDFSDDESLVEGYEVVEYDHEITQRAAQKELTPRPKIKSLYKIDEARIEESLRMLKELETEEEGIIEEQFINKDSLILEEGFRILAITNLPPIWAVVIGKEGKYFLAKIESENHEISFSDFLDLDLTSEGFLIKPYANYLFVVTRWGKLLKIIDIEGQAKIAFSQEFSFSDSQVGKIIDMCPY
ncbi:hypothetical protein NDI39_23540 [Microcoleus sp. ZQ-A2]|nr:hypothetical protein [Microcoleus sp. FACHB-1]